MNDLQLIRICTLLNIGQSTLTPIQVGGGLLHQVWHVTTTQQEFAFKELNPEIMLKPEIQKQYQEGWEVATRAAQQGIPTTTPHRYKGESLLAVEGGHFFVFDWIKGGTLKNEQIKPLHAMQIGEILDKLHRLKLSKTLVEAREPPSFSNDYWDDLVDKFYHPPLPTLYSASLGETLSSFLPEIHKLNQLAIEAYPYLLQNTVVSHGDLDPKNVIWRGDYHPIVIDWESAQPLNKTLEVIACALDWAGITTGTLDFNRYFALIEGYSQSGSRLSSLDLLYAIHGVGGQWLIWLEFNLRRAIGLSSIREKEQALGAKMIMETVQVLKCLSNNMTALINNTPSS